MVARNEIELARMAISQGGSGPARIDAIPDLSAIRTCYSLYGYRVWRCGPPGVVAAFSACGRSLAGFRIDDLMTKLETLRESDPATPADEDMPNPA